MAGLVETTTTAGGSESAATGATTTTDAVGVTTDLSGVSHLDTFFETSGWTREDIETLAALLNLLLLALLVYREVNR